MNTKKDKNFNFYEPVLDKITEGLITLEAGETFKIELNITINEKITFIEAQLEIYLYQKLHDYFKIIKELHN